MPDIPYNERIKAAHKRGHLFAHMFEDSLEEYGLEGGIFPLKNLFDVMARKTGARYKNAYSHDFPVNKQFGIAGLIATALHQKYPVPLFTEMSNVGLLMDTAKPVLVHVSDGHTLIRDNAINYIKHDNWTSVEGLQGLPEGSQGVFRIDWEEEKWPVLGESALDALWHQIGKMGWDGYINSLHEPKRPGMNEVNVAADLKDICGIVVCRSGEEEKDAASLRAAVQLKRDLVSQYSDFIGISLPIMSYDLSRHQASEIMLEPLTPRQIDAILDIQTQTIR